MKILLQSFISITAVLLCNGCATNALWSDRNVHQFSPTNPANLDLLQRKDGAKILVTYDEILDHGSNATKRAYWINPRIEPSNVNKKPIFVSLRSAKGLQRIPICEKPQPNGYSVMTSTNGAAFILFQNGQQLWMYKLPEYESATPTAKQVALTPLAAAADATVVGGLAALYYFYYQAGGTGTPDFTQLFETK